MKKMLSIAVINVLLFISASSQNYQLLNSNKQYIYSDELGSAVGLEMDSVKLEGTDSLFYPSKIFLKTSLDPECFDPFASSFLGDCIIVKQDGFNNIINADGDTIFIKTNALLNESWLAYKDDEIKIEATIYQVSNMEIYDEMDSVKIIHFQAHDMEMNPLDHNINQESFSISKHYGVKACSNMALFPEVEIQYEYEMVQEETIINHYALIGQTNPSKGLQNLKWFEVHDFQVGDEIHIKIINIGIYNNDTIFMKQRFLQRDNYLDSIVYQVELRKIVNHHEINRTTTFTIDTIHQVYTKNENFDKLPKQSFAIYNSGNCYSMNINNPNLKFKKNVIYSDSYDNGCYYENFVTGDCTSEFEYKKGLGGPYRVCDYFGGMYANETILLYYKKGTEEWGTPIDFTVNITEKTELSKISMYPNPVKDFLEIETASKEILDYKLIDLSGKILLYGQLNQKQARINLSLIDAGLYFLIIENQKLKLIKE